MRIAFNASDPHPVTVTTATGVQHKAHHVLVTVSIGVLKEPGQLTFSPPLTARKRDAITAVGFGTLGKVILVYGTKFWDKLQPGLRGMQLLWNDGVNVDDQRRYVR